MKVLITYASAGSGHFKAASALYSYIKEHCPQIELKLTDALEKTNPVFSFFYSRGYSFLIMHLVWLWRFFFWVTNSKGLRPLIRLAGSVFNRLNTKGFIKFLISDNFDFIISTHFLSSQLCSSLKKSKQIESNLITIITDFGVHPFWLSDATDIYVVACEFTKRQLLLESVLESRIKEFGIPTEEKFLKRQDRSYLSNKLNIDGNRFTVLIMTGSFGLGPLEEIVDTLYKDVQCLVVCANNKKLYAKLTRRDLVNTKAFGFIDNMQELMAVSDIIITKPGGLTIAEALNMELVPLFISSIPGQEECNARILKEYGIGFTIDSIDDIKNIVLDLKSHPHKLESIRDNIKKVRKPDALREICNVVCQGSAGFSC